MRFDRFAVVVLAAFLSACSNESGPDAVPAPGSAEATEPQSVSPNPAGGVPANGGGAGVVPPAAATQPASKSTVVPAGTAINVTLIDGISSEKNKAGDQFQASLSEPLVVDGKTVAEKGTIVQGRIVDAIGAGRVKGVASMRIVLTSIMDGEKAIPLATEELLSEAEATKGRDAAVVGGAAGVGAAIGALAGGKKGAAIGAIVGGGSGAGAVIATKGKEVEYGPESKLVFTLQQATELPTITRKTS